MLKFLIIIDSYIYFLIPVIWFLIAVINTQIYWYYNNEAVTRSAYLSKWEGNILLFFTFRWSFDEGDSIKIVRLKKIVNYLSIYFAIHILISFLLWYYIKNNNPLNLWAGY